MVQLNNTLVMKAKVVHMNRASLILELAPNERVMVTRRVFNTIQSNPDIPMFLVHKEYMGHPFDWIAIPLTL
jgi:hypothetical protein